MLNFVYILLLALSPSAGARPMEFFLSCSWSSPGGAPIGAPRYQVKKSVFRDRGGRWSFRYSLVVRPLNPSARPEEAELVSAGSGDEDYNEYRLAGGPKHGIAGASIQNSFQWASLVSTGGSASYDCRPE